ncbi:MAG: TlpA disulfide reductase family protein [Fimbriimonadaceae bacterium]|nr:TlpA disulfide reductase family protein [Fimbriimonadaceae bacterium]
MNRFATRGFRNALLLAGMAAVLFACEPPAPEGEIGALAPEFEVQQLATGTDTVSSTEFKGKVMVIDFWATWCGPCRKAFPEFEKTFRDYQDKGVVFAAITDEDRKVAEEFIRRMDYSFPFYRDPFGLVAKGFKVNGLPSTVVVGKDGKIVAHFTGADPASLRAAIDEALAKS